MRSSSGEPDDYQWLANFGFQASRMLRAAFFGVSAAGQSTPYHRTGALAARRTQPQIGALSKTRTGQIIPVAEVVKADLLTAS